jgi:3,4-dihydroxy 2-butanone 4-phosphate synthase/GTP cyclohydrolase II
VDVRVHNQRSFVDILAKNLPNDRIQYGLRLLSQSDRGVFVYLSRPHPYSSWESELEELTGRATDHAHQRAAPDMRHIGTGAQILRSLGVKKMRVHTTSTASLKGLSGFDLEVVENIIMNS